ncbi:hypothetical protein RHGRI_026806 [Rhododendron griersonianum]|uniref:F-box associated beta-propeller type 1 domain-containing protein n=1 Tax=Rhododendron griersonianum TaxID=479676 RepID=A0AAV6IZ35_9ERIC|nr:hypothetical protein RHGRI_026806 [Rhododendron griersonianum]
MAEVLVLDAAIRDWVLIPLSVVMMVLIGFLGYSISNLMDSSQSPGDNSKIVKTYMTPARNLRAKSFRANEPGTTWPVDFINCAEVYELGSGSWRVLNVDDIVQEVYVSDEAIISMYNHNDGVFHWHSLPNDRGRGVDTDYVFGELVLSFDMSTELFQLTLLPERYTEFRPALSFSECHLALLGDSLAAIFSLCVENHITIEVWVMKKDFNRLVEAGESFSSYRWSHEFTMEPPPSLYTCISVGFWNKNELLIWTDVQPFDFRSRGRGTPLLYNMVTKQARDLQISGEPNFIYKDSLVSVTGGCGN